MSRCDKEYERDWVHWVCALGEHDETVQHYDAMRKRFWYLKGDVIFVSSEPPNEFKETETPITDQREQVGGDHYQFSGMQPIDLITSMGILPEFVQGNIIRYASRLGRKGEKKDWVSDLKKIQQYCDFLIKHYEGDES